jgi:hypothetical protein
MMLRENTSKIIYPLNNKMHIGGTHCDLTAFDCMNHELFISKLNFNEV